MGDPSAERACGAVGVGFGGTPGVTVVDYPAGITDLNFLGGAPLIERGVANASRPLEVAALTLSEGNEKEREMMESIRAIAVTALASSFVALPASAQELEKLSIKFIGQNSVEQNHTFLEKPFFETFPARTGGKVTVDLQPFNVAGLKGPEILRLMKLGSIDWASNGTSYLAGDNPEFEGCDLAGTTKSLDQAYQACLAYKPVLARIMEKGWNTKLLALYSNPPQVLWCRAPIKGLADIKGKKVRVGNTSLTDFVEGAGGTTVTMPFADVVPALQRGVADCAITGSFNGNLAKWYEVTTHIYPLNLGWATQYAAVNLDVWRKLSSAMQKFIAESFVDLEKKSWTELTKKTTEEGVACNIGRDPCTLGTKAKIIMVDPLPGDEQLRLKIIRESVLSRWAKRCGANCAKEWNATAGKILNVAAPAN